MTDANSFTKLVPGFDFLQGLVKNAGAALPGIGQWVAPTLNPEELDKRIEELRTVQFWLEQNARMIGATIQALEVQRMTLSTLKTMNVQMSDLRDSLQIKMPEPAAAPARKAPAAAEPAAEKAAATSNPDTEAAAPAVDPMQWWGALTKQFTELAATAMKDSASKGLAAAMGRQSVDGVDSAATASTSAAKKAPRKSTPAARKRSAAAKNTNP